MKKTVFCVIAHPDDEAFGPSGKLATLSQTHDVHVVCVTDGASDPRFHPIVGKKLSDVRSVELGASASARRAARALFYIFRTGRLIIIAIMTLQTS